ncbi:DEAD/DEAH box helicase [Streptomyces sp. GESEQ-35]|uniref:DEAD/DEAH box helicase family protein n=1 Tax=Streptomyces sp. GESEQ-35 TaxID=2812657 RepID=UPI001B32AECB|nr:DEAD/DEAH box helicase [Streptomyces sp. GESEQ-35]
MREDVARSATGLSRLLATDIAEQAVWPSDVDLEALGFVRRLRPFQQVAVARLLAAGGGANFSVPGSGKTAVTYAVFTALRSRGSAHAMLVVAPPSAFEAWVDEAKACFADDRTPVVTVRPDLPSRRDTILVLNYERLSDATSRAGLSGWARGRKVLTVFDEAHRAKAGPTSRRGAEAAALARRSDATMVLTGTPMPNRPTDLEAVFDLAWPGHGSRLVRGDLANARERAYVRATKAELDLPTLEVRVERVALDGPHRALYDAMRLRMSEWANAHSHSDDVAADAGRAVMHLIAAATNPAAVFTPDQPWSLPFDRPDFTDLRSVVTDPTLHIRPAKIVRAAQLVTENRALGRKTVVWSTFVANIAALTTALARHNPAVITGATAVDEASAPTDRRRQLERFRTDDDCWALIATPQTLGEGVSLHQTAIDQVHVDRGYAAGTWLQAIDRTHRLGLPADANPTCTVLIAEDTIDERVSEVLNAKVTAMASALNDHALQPVADPMIAEGDSVAAVLGDIDALRELLRPEGEKMTTRRDASSGGIHITSSGAQINTGNVGGDQRQVYVSGNAEDTSLLLAAQTKLAELNAALEEHAAELSNPDLARRTASRIGEELTSRNPDRRRITENLEDLGLAVGAVASIITILQGLTAAVAALHG